MHGFFGRLWLTSSVLSVEINNVVNMNNISK